MRRCLDIGLLLLLAAHPLAAQADAPLLLARGIAAAEALDPATALPLFEQALAADSGSVEAAWRGAVAAADIARVLEAADSAEAQRDSLNAHGARLAQHAVATDSLSADAWFALAYTLGRTALTLPVRARIRQGAAIRDAALRAIELDPEHDGAYHVLGRWHAEIMRLSGISRFFARSFLGARMFDDASWEDAIANLERAVALDPSYLYHRLDLAEVLVDRKQWDAARRQLEVIPGLPDRDVLDPVHRERAAALLAAITGR